MFSRILPETSERKRQCLRADSEFNKLTIFPLNNETAVAWFNLTEFSRKDGVLKSKLLLRAARHSKPGKIRQNSQIIEICVRITLPMSGWENSSMTNIVDKLFGVEIGMNEN